MMNGKRPLNAGFHSNAWPTWRSSSHQLLSRLAFWLWRPTAMAGMWTVWSPAQFGQAGDVPIRRPRWGKAVWRRTIDAFTRIIIP